ncbi:MAG: Fe-S protein [Anaerolineales bacterium]|nr:epoxyqueuosine reductase [Anaerolineae bacterium]PWB50488.1 MAG: Fe-S protein [Anaerolineales bacterium]
MAINKSIIIREQMLQQVEEFGASLAGIARVDDLKKSPSYLKYAQNPYYSYFTSYPEWPEGARSILVFGLLHKKSEPELDWWDPKPGGTPGNRALIRIQKKQKAWFKDELGINSISLPYKIEEGGIFLKDASSLAGIGIIGKNNLLISREYGPRVRLRAMFLEIELEATSPLDFDPCLTCDKPCYRACPQNAFRSGFYERKYCELQMKKDEANVRPLPGDPSTDHVRYCRACELACPVGK